MPRFFAEITRFPAARIIGREVVHHITGSLRKRRGDEIAIRVGTQGYRAKIASIDKEQILVDVLVEEALLDRGDRVIHLAMCLIEMKDFEDAVRSVTELGVLDIHPVISSRSSIRVVTDARYARWQVIILEAVKQCGRKTIPLIHQPEALDIFLRAIPHIWGKKLVADKDAHSTISENRGDDVGILIGPEGGFSPEELEMIRYSGFLPVSLGNTTLKATTAAVAAVSILGL